MAESGSRIRIAVDGMGGDNAPTNIVAGAVEAARKYGSRLIPILVGDRDELLAEINRLGASDLDLEIVHAAERVEMAEAAVDSFRKKKDSSLSVATRMVREGKAEGVFSAGNTGAMVAASLLNLGRIPGVNRPAIATTIPTSGSPPWAIILDVGAAADSKPINLYQFGLLGDIYYRTLFQVERPRIGLLNIGEESSKGNDLAQEAHGLLAEGNFNFVGNVEGRDILGGGAHVVVTDGFTGNVLLKYAESIWSWTMGLVKREVGAHILAKFGALLLRPSIRRLRKRMDYSEYGGAPLLGLNGIALVGHGSSNANAVCNGIRFAADLVEQGLVEEIRSAVDRDTAGKGGEVVST